MANDISEVNQDADRWLLNGDLPCLNDGYNLRGLVGPIVKCPECGHPNDLRDPSPWRKKDLPLGVREREHWPSSAAACGLMLPVFGFLSQVFLTAFSLWGLAVCGSLFVTTLVLWWVKCRKFIHSAKTPKWALFILTAAHLAPSLTLIGLVAGMMALVAWKDGYPDTNPTPYAITAALAPLGLGLFAWLKTQLKGCDNPSTFRVDWRQYRIPTNAEP